MLKSRLAQKQPRISAIVVGYKSRDCIARCIESLQKSTIPLDIIVVNNIVVNARDPQSVEDIVAHFKDVTCHNTGDNLGYAGGVNVGLRLAQDHKADYVFIMNPDAYIAPDCVARLLASVQKNPEIGIASPKTYYANSNTIWFAGATLDLKNGTSPHIGQGQKDGPEFSKNHDMPRANGCAMFIPVDALQKVGPMEDKYFLYFEEIDWSLRFHKAGYRIRFVADAHVWHAASTSTGGFFTPLYQYYTTRNSLAVFRQFGESPWPAFLARHIIQSCKRLLNIARNQPRNIPGVTGAIILGYFDYTRGRFGRHDF
ncbi:MAG TPA: glycosyltransferase family 2 protein [Candidatus Saccharimonadales bacterium]